MTLQSLLRTGLAAAALTLTTAAFGLTTPALAYQPVPDQTAEQQRLMYWDVGVKFTGAAFRPEQYGNGEDVAFEIRNLGSDVAYPNIKLTAFCNYREWSTNNFTGSDKQPAKYMGMVAGSPPAPFLVTCPAKYHQSVSSVTLQSETKGDGYAANNMAYWDSLTGGHSN